MSQGNQIQLKPLSILQVPFYSYQKDFTFIVNGEEFKTSRIFSDLISSKISQMHSNDPTFDTFYINTQAKGDFSYILNLFDFQPKSISNTQIPFISEVFEQLGIKSIEFTSFNQPTEITKDNVFTQLMKNITHVIQNSLKPK